MSTTIDEKVVEMRFDNKDFEEKTKSTVSLLEKLKSSLKLDGATKGFDNISKAANKVDLSGFGGAVDAIKVKFSAMEIVAVSVLSNIANTAISAGKNLVNAFTLEPIMSGFQEYETQINSVQTILANTQSKGTTLDQVNAALDELNHYADLTIYNFTEMTRNIGTFTAAGVDLDTSVKAIQGIANLAAVSGSNAQQASTAMYQLSQALAAGTVKLQDWNSVVNAGMGGQVFQDALKETARIHGIAIDEMIADEGSFRETLQKGWLTSEILTETLSKFTKSGVNEYIAEHSKLTAEEIQKMREEAEAADGSAVNYDKLAKSIAAKSDMTEEEIKELIKMSDTAEDAATKVKTFSQLLDTLKEAAQSGWTQSWEIIVGDFEEAKTLLTEISDVFSNMINKSANARNAMLQNWKDLGGRTLLIESLKNTFEGLLSILKPIDEAFNEIFPPMTGERLYEITKKLRDLTAYLKIGKQTSDQLKSSFKGMFAVLDILKQALSAGANGFFDLSKALLPAGHAFLEITSGIGSYLVSLDETIRKTDIFNKVVRKGTTFIQNSVTVIVQVLSTIISGLNQFRNFVSEKFNFNPLDTFQAILLRISARMQEVKDSSDSMKSSVVVAAKMMGDALKKSDFPKLMSAIWNGVKMLSGGILQTLGTAMKSITDKIANVNFNSLIDFFNSVAVGGIFVTIAKFLKNVTKPLEGLNGILEGVTSILDEVRGCFEAYQTQLKAGTLMRIAIAIGILSASIVALSLIDSDKLSASIGGMTMLFVNLMGAMAILGRISSSPKSVFKTSTMMIAMSISIKILAGSLKNLAELDWKGIAKGLIGITGLTATVTIFAKVISTQKKKIIKGATGLVIFAAAIKILASVCKDLSELSWKQIAKGLIAVGVLMAEIAAFLNLAKFSLKTTTTATGIVILAAAMKVLASSCKDFGQLSVKQIEKGLGSIGALLAEIAVFTNLTGKAKHVISTGAALVIIGTSMKIFASAVSDFGSMNWESIGRGLTAMGGALAEVAASVNLMPKRLIFIGTGLLVVGAALKVLADALSNFGSMQWESIGKGLTVLGGALAELSIALNLMKGTLSGSASLLVAVSALNLLVPVLATLSKKSWKSLAKSLIVLAGAFTILGVAGAILRPLLPTIIGLAGAFTLVGVSVLAIGAGLMAAGTGLSALAIGFTSLAAAGAAGATAVVASLTIIITGVAALIPAVLTEIGKGIISICQVIAEGASVIGDMIKSLVLTLVDVMVECVPQIVDGIFQLLTEAASALVKYTPQLASLFTDFLVEVINGIAKNVPKLVKAVVNALSEFFAGIVDAFKGLDISVLLKGIAGVGILAAIMTALQGVVALLPGAMSGILGIGAVIAEIAIVLAAVGAFAQIPGLSWFIGEGGELLEKIGTAIGSFVGGIAGGFMSGVSSQFPKIGSDLSDFMTNIQPFIEGASKIQSSSLDGVSTLSKTILALTAADVLQGISSWITGGSSLSKFANELVPFGEAIAAYSESVDGKISSEAVEASANAGKALVSLSKELPNSGGILSIFSGDNRIDEFGDQLVSFGNAITDYSESVSSIDGGLVSTTNTIASAINTLQNLVPEGEHGLFTKKNSLADVGDSLTSFGKSLNAFYENISGISAESITSVTNELKNLVAMANTMQGLDTGAISNFSSALSNAGKAGVDGFINAFTGAYGKAQTVGSTFVQFIVTGIRSRQNLVPQMFMNLVKLTIGRLRSSASQFAQVGMSFAVKMANGIRNGGSRARNAASSMAYSAARGARVGYSSFYEAGAYAARGFANGISANAYKAEAQARAMANAASRAAKKALNEHSPSKVFYQIGDYAGVAFVNALHDNIKPVYDVSMAMANSATNGIHAAINQISKVLNSDLDAQPVIRPVVDLNGINAGTMAINGMNRQLQGLHIGSYGMTLTERISGSNIRNKNAMYSNQDVVEAIDRLEASMYNMEMVMDTGALVGSIENKMDQRLGMRALYKGRGN